MVSAPVPLNVRECPWQLHGHAEARHARQPLAARLEVALDGDLAVAEDRVESRVAGVACALEDGAETDSDPLGSGLSHDGAVDPTVVAGVAPDGQFRLPATAEVVVRGSAPEIR